MLSYPIVDLKNEIDGTTRYSNLSIKRFKVLDRKEQKEYVIKLTFSF